jgi:hypothetical protein
MSAFKTRLGRVARSLPFRLVFALAIVAFHLVAMARLGRERLDYKFNESPDHAPMLLGAHGEGTIQEWDRLIVSRWDAQHYMGLGMRGYRFCKDKSELRPGEFPDSNPACQLHFYPGYGFLGAAVARVLQVPIDYALFGVSMVACAAIALMWTGKAMTDALGTDNAYLSLILMNAFTSAFILVTIETEPVLLALSMGAFVCLARRRWLAAALLAGAASAIRITGVATGFAVCAALLVTTLRDHPRPGPAWLKSVTLMAISGWGVLTIMTYFAVRFGDPMAYAHSYEREYHTHASLSQALFPDGRLLMQSLWAEPNDGVFLAAALLWFALGHRAGLGRFSVEGQAYWYTLYFATVGISAVGSVANAFGGAARYVLAALPLFFAMAAVMRHKPVVLALWLFMSLTHYYNGGICMYESQSRGDRAQRCTFARSFRSDDIKAGRP